MSKSEAFRVALSDTEELEPTRLRGRRGSKSKKPETCTEDSATRLPRSYLRLSYSDRDLHAHTIQPKPILARVGPALGKKINSIVRLPEENRGLRRRGASDAALTSRTAYLGHTLKLPESSNDLRNAPKAEIGRVSQTPLARQLYTRSHNFISRPLQQRSSPDVLYTSTPPVGGRHRYRPSESFLSFSVGSRSLLHLSIPQTPSSPDQAERRNIKKVDRQIDKMKDRRPATASGALEGRSSSRSKARSRVAKPSPETESRHAVVVRPLID